MGDVCQRVQSLYRRFAEVEAAGVSDTYFGWASGVAADVEVADLIAGLPPGKRQPNLVFAAARHLGAPVGDYPPFRAWLIESWTAVVDVVLARSTQTNEAARCAVLLPVLSRLEGPLALIEAGASAALCLYPDRYSYRYDVAGQVVGLDPADGPSPVEIPCAVDARAVPTRLPQVAWRAGADLHCLDPADEEQVGWLQTLVWPEHEERRHRLRAAARVAAAHPPDQLVEGDLLDAVPELIARAPAGTHVVVFHSSVLVYLPAERRQAFAEQMLARPEVTWISNEGPDVFPFMSRRVTMPVAGRTVVAVDGVPVGLAGPHGQSYQSLAEMASRRTSKPR